MRWTRIQAQLVKTKIAEEDRGGGGPSALVEISSWTDIFRHDMVFGLGQDLLLGS